MMDNGNQGGSRQRRGPSVDGAVQTLAVIGLVIGLLAAVQVRPQSSSGLSGIDPQVLAESTEAAGTGTGTAGATGGGATGSGGGAGAGGATSPEQCAQASGATPDVGVSAKEILLGATVVESGIGASFLGPVRTAMIAVKDRVNREGGICGRQLGLRLVDDAWQAEKGCDFIKNLVEDTKVFMLAVNPSSEGLRACDSYVESKKVPVVGSDGMLIHQYTNAYIWPVATSTISQMHIMAKNVCDRYSESHGGNCRDMNVGIVYDSNYHFGVEGAYAFNAAMRRLTGRNIEGYSDPLRNPKCQKRFCGVTAGQPSYSSQVQEFNDNCTPGEESQAQTCQFAAMLLEPPTALVWVRDGAYPAYQYPFKIGGAQPLFNRDFAVECRDRCDQMWLWTGYKPPIEQFASEKGVQKYEREIKQIDSTIDTANAFVEGGWIGMNLVVEVLEKIGPNLKRESVVVAMDGFTLDLGVSTPLTWKKGNHFANPSAHAFSIEYKQNFSGWRYQQTGLIKDPWLGQDIPAGE